MSREHKPVRLMKAPFSGEWRAVRVGKDGRTVTDFWPLHEDDDAALDAMESAHRVTRVRTLREAADAARAAWAPDPCPWVGFLDDRADEIERGTR